MHNRDLSAWQGKRGGKLKEGKSVFIQQIFIEYIHMQVMLLGTEDREEH